ncbi:nickel transporter permease [Paenibacillus hunanensis]|uniref:Peptide/nickel transport system permease protein n=1 Tax=Paenibacillus hunanensis TaxID=539262 RepID=A0ABU1IW11_9BACL|nr:nickel transporter permease [Paenibacillus hunanensis]MCL9659393.1 ABC transporter permease [Paenibacillus hunanensis]MDR6243364.1 peptide/nickel transport system permease protein [Paenibacillus hunanensis]GGI97159.1 diguanylate cyclase [Paenibacillus hunanensis]
MTQASLGTGSDRPAKMVRSGPWRDGIRLFMRNRTAVVGLIIVLLFIVLALIAPWITRYEYTAQVLADRLQPPSAKHWFGTDDLGRDIFTRTIYGARISLWVGFLSVIGSIVIGTLLGIVAGFYGKWVDMIISRVFDILLAFPGILLAIAIVAILGPSLQNALYAIAIVNIPTYGRLVRARVLSLRQEEFITAARAIGVRDARLLFRHILPNSLTPLIVQGTLGVATAIIEAAGLGFLGLGAQPPEPEWGKMLSDSRQFIQTAPWTVIFPGVCILLTSLGFNLMGDGLRDTFDPKLKNR